MWNKIKCGLLVFVLLNFFFSCFGGQYVTLAEGNDIIKVACVGDSITYGAEIKNRDVDGYPAVLNNLLGSKYKVKNFGVSSTCLLLHGDYPYQTTGMFADSKAWSPDIVVIMLGTNDSKPQNWIYSSQFIDDYKNLITQYQNLSPHPKIILNTPPVVYNNGAWGITESIIKDEIIPKVQQVAKEMGCTVVDIQQVTNNMSESFPDNVHPNPKGAKIIAENVYKVITADGFFTPSDQNQTSKEITVEVDGKRLSCDVPPQIINDRVMVPLRAIFEALGTTIDWNENTNTITSKKDDITIQLKIDSPNAIVNDTERLLDVPATIVNDRTLIPIRFVSESFGMNVVWDQKTQTVIITPNLAFNKQCVSSSNETEERGPEYAVDGKDFTRWSSKFEDQQWFYVDLGSSTKISKVTIKWEAAYSSDFSIEVSDEASNPTKWTEVYNEENGDGGTEILSFKPVKARYVKVNCKKRKTQYGNSFYEFEVYNK